MTESSEILPEKTPAAVRRPSDLVTLRRRVVELEVALAESEVRALAWARYYAAATVTIGAIKKLIPANYRKQGIPFADLSHQILRKIKSQPDQLDAAKLLVSAVVTKLNIKLDIRIEAQSGPFNPNDLKKWLTAQIDEW